MSLYSTHPNLAVWEEVSGNFILFHLGAALEVAVRTWILSIVWSIEDIAGVLEEQEVVDIERLEEELNSASPFEIMDQALALFGTDIAIAFRFLS